MSEDKATEVLAAPSSLRGAGQGSPSCPGWMQWHTWGCPKNHSRDSEGSATSLLPCRASFCASSASYGACHGACHGSQGGTVGIPASPDGGAHEGDAPAGDARGGDVLAEDAHGGDVLAGGARGSDAPGGGAHGSDAPVGTDQVEGGHQESRLGVPEDRALEEQAALERSRSGHLLK